MLTLETANPPKFISKSELINYNHGEYAEDPEFIDDCSDDSYLSSSSSSSSSSSFSSFISWNAESSDTNDPSSGSEFTTTEPDKIQSECMCIGPKCGAKKKAEARASAAKLHDGSQKPFSRHRRESSSSSSTSDCSTDSDSSSECVSARGPRKFFC